MILVTGAGGKTGNAIIKKLIANGESVRGFVHSQQSAMEISKLGAKHAVVGDLLSLTNLINAMHQVTAIYHICPNVHPEEVIMGQNVLSAAKQGSVEHIVYHSVLHPQIEAMPHHWNKLRVEELIFTSGIPFTILQPAPYMQNILGQIKAIKELGAYTIPYRANALFSLVDLENVADAASKIIGNKEHHHAIYELSGTEIFSPQQIAVELTASLQKPVTAREISTREWEDNAREVGLGGYQRDTLIKMFHYYNDHGLTGNGRALEILLGKSSTSLSKFLKREFSSS